MEIKYCAVTTADRLAALKSVSDNLETNKNTIFWEQIIIVTGMVVVIGIYIHQAYIDKKKICFLLKNQLNELFRIIAESDVETK